MVRSPRRQHESRPFLAQHLEWAHALDAESDAHVRDLDLADGLRGRLLVRDHDMAESQRLGDQVVVGDLQESAHGSWRVAVRCDPGADLAQRGQGPAVGRQEQRASARPRPVGKLV